jgi:hypothetical protein
LVDALRSFLEQLPRLVLGEEEVVGRISGGLKYERFINWMEIELLCIVVLADLFEAIRQ